MQDVNECVTTHARTYNNFYTLWSVLALSESDELLPPTEAAAAFSKLMDQLTLLKAKDDLEAFLREQEESTFSDAHTYLVNATGSS